MARGVSIKKDYPLEEMIKIVHEENGRIRAISRRCQCSPTTIYDYIDCYPELQEARKLAQNRSSQTMLETAEVTTEKLLELVEEKPEIAAKLSMFVMKHSKYSDYRVGNTADDNESQAADHLLTKLERYINESTSE